MALNYNINVTNMRYYCNIIVTQLFNKKTTKKKSNLKGTYHSIKNVTYVLQFCSEGYSKKQT